MWLLHVHVLHVVCGFVLACARVACGLRFGACWPVACRNVHIGVACARVCMQCAVWGPIEANEAVGRCYVCAMALFACGYLQRLLVVACCANLSASWTCVAQNLLINPVTTIICTPGNKFAPYIHTYYSNCLVGHPPLKSRPNRYFVCKYIFLRANCSDDVLPNQNLFMKRRLIPKLLKFEYAGTDGSPAHGSGHVRRANVCGRVNWLTNVLNLNSAVWTRSF